MSIKDILDAAASLPYEERAIIVDSLLKGLNPPVAAIEEKWLLEAKKRLDEIRSGKVIPITGEEVFKKLMPGFQNEFFIPSGC